MTPRITRRRKRLAAGAACCLAAGAFAFGVALGDGQAPEPSAASRLDLRSLAGLRIVVGIEGTEAPRRVRRMIRAGEATGVILFAGSFPSRAAGRRLIERLQRIPRPAGPRDPLLVMVDQEGGLVKRVSGAPTASAREMGAMGAGFSRRQGERTAANLRNVAVNVNLAPVLDVARPGGTIAETDRGFGATAMQVTASAVPFAEGLEAGGVPATAKHFPGMGAARANTDFAVERIDLSKSTLREVDEVPYRRFIDAGGAMVMLSTAIYPAFSSKPAAFARQIVTGELRRRLGFDGVAITDALDSVAVRAFGGPAKAGVAAARAGVDLLLFADPGSGARAYDALLRRLRSGSLSRSAFEESATRTLRLRHHLRS